MVKIWKRVKECLLGVTQLEDQYSSTLVSGGVLMPFRYPSQHFGGGLMRVENYTWRLLLIVSCLKQWRRR